MINQADLSARLAADSNDLSALRQSARQNSPEALKAAAKQFEALFMNMVMKSMRDATPQDGLFDSEQSKMYTSMLDQQISQNMASRGVGLADVLIRQLSNNRAAEGMPAADGEDRLLQGLQQSELGSMSGVERAAQRLQGFAPASAAPAPAAALPEQRAAGAQPAHVQAFQSRLAAHADEASRTTGIPAKFMLGQAALETGWGKHEITAADGSRSHNLFGIKAGAGWKGKVVEAATTEYVNGVAQRKTEKFRAYDSYADSFRDYARLLRNNPRYENVIANAQDAVGFANGLQRAGYATDPNYAAKLTRIIRQTLA
jgi:flagellar protein FlgJ